MTTRTELDTLLGAYENYIGTGNMKQAGRTLPKIIRALVTFVEERTPDHVEAEAPTLTVKIAHNAPPQAVEAVISTIKAEFTEGATCPPCDVSIPNNPSLIDEFKNPLEALAEKAAELVGDLKVDLEEAIEEVVDLVHPDDDKAPEEVTEEKVADETTPPVIEADPAETPPVEETTAPAPKTPKKPKATD